MRGISFKYDQHSILKDFHLKIERGDFLGIKGISGKGKTSILNLLLGFVKPVKGEILVNGQVIRHEDLHTIWPCISYVRQQPFLIHDTLLRNIVLTDGEYDSNKLEQVIHLSGLDELTSRHNEGLRMFITENGKNISGGQQQRIAIARALYHDAGLFLLDEPFNELDHASTTRLLGHFNCLTKKGKTVVMITHDSTCLAACNKVISLNE